MQYQRRVIAQSPSQGDLINSLNGGNIAAQGAGNANHFHNRNQSMDVVNANKIKNKLQQARKRPGGHLNNLLSPNNMQDDGGENRGLDE